MALEDIMSAIIALFIIKRVEFRLFSLFGLYSYEVYLIHWPLMYHYDVFYRYLPAWLATIAYLALFIVISWLIKIFADYVLEKAKLDK